jgi:probable HAF family extracellular repeat protein
MYTVTDVGVMPGMQNCSGQDINTTGQVAGYCQAGSAVRAFFWSNGSMQDVGTLGGNET